MDRLKAISSALVRRFGTPVIFLRTTGSAYDPAAGVMAGGSTATYQVSVLLQEYHPAMIAYSNGLITVHDRKATVADAAYIPQPGDVVSIGGVAYQVLEVTDNTLAGTREVHLRPV